MAAQLRNQPETRTEPIVVLVPIIVAQGEAAGAAAGAAGAGAAESDENTTAAAAPIEDAAGQDKATAGAPVEDAAANNEAAGGGQAYVVQPGDTLTTLAQEYLGNQVRYREIVAATNERAATDPEIDTITNADVISVGQTIWIPAE
jgi:nucleoid-associated protein YgaU